MNILVTGGAGFIGSHLIEALHAAGHVVINVDEVNDYYDVNFKIYNLSILKDYDRYHFYQTDINDEEKLIEIMQRHLPEVVVHLGARAGVRRSMEEPKLYRESIYQGTQRLYAVAQRCHVQQFIFGSTSSVYGNSTVPFTETAQQLQPISEYAKLKLLTEQWLEEQHTATALPTTILRFFTVYGERGRPDMAPYLFTKAILTQQPITQYGDGSNSRDYTYIADIIAGIMAAIQTRFDFEIINLGNNQGVTLKEFIHTLEQITTLTAKMEFQPQPQWDANHTLANIDKAKRLLNYQPHTNLEAGLSKFVDWFRRHRL